MNKSDLTIAVAVNNLHVLRNNLFASAELAVPHQHEIIIRENYPSASVAYNSAIDEATNDIIVFVHQDVYFPGQWFEDLRKTIKALDDDGVAWGVLGCFGNRLELQGGIGSVYTTGRGVHGRAIETAQTVETLDEIVLVIRKSSGLRFDAGLPSFHLYGTDLCLTAKSRGLRSLVVSGFCIHNTNEIVHLPREFMECYQYIKRKWYSSLPIKTSCITISSLNTELWIGNLRALWSRTKGKQKAPNKRIDDPRVLLQDCAAYF